MLSTNLNLKVNNKIQYKQNATEIIKEQPY